MKPAWGFAFFLLFLAGFAIVNLRNVANEATDSIRVLTASDLDGSAWRLRALPGTAVSRDATIELLFDTGGDLRVLGACNRFSGKWRIAENRAALGPLAATRRACEADIMHADRAFIEVLGRVQVVKGSDRGLLLYDAGEKLIATLRRVAANDGGNQ